ncbi:MAG: class I SAM-dependent methyltransferase [Promethearchaeota archaeon]
MNKKFYDQHLNFTNRTLSEYNIAPGIKCKFDLISSKIGNIRFKNGIDVGCSGNSFFHFLRNIKQMIFFDLAHHPLKQYAGIRWNHPINGDITRIPFRNDFFDLITALDVLEHISDDESACSELVRILEPGGVLVITVPHRMKYYTDQDRICGHIRRYEYERIKNLFKTRGLRELAVFPVYGQIMRVQFLQEINPKKTEQNLIKLRKKYISSPVFRKLWNKFMAFSSRLMKLDAKYIPFKKSMDICLIFKKIGKKERR